MPKPLTLSYLRSEALAYFETAADAIKDKVYVQNPGDDTTDKQRHADFQLLLRDSRLERRVTYYLGKPVGAKAFHRLLTVLRAAYKIRGDWAKQERDWERQERPFLADPSTAEFVRGKGPISSFVRSYIAKPIDTIALDAHWFVAADAVSSDDDDEIELLPRPPRIDQAKRDAAIEEQTVIMACVPDDILLAVYDYATPALRSKLPAYSELLFTRYHSRRAVDLSNVLCHLDKVRGKATQTLASEQRFFGPDVLQLIAKFACDPRGRPLPVRAPRLLDNTAIASALTQVIQNMKPLGMTRDATRACLKRILESIPDSSSSKSTSPSVPKQAPKKKRRRAPRHQGPWWNPQPAVAAAAGIPAPPQVPDIGSSDDDESEDDGDEAIAIWA